MEDIVIYAGGTFDVLHIGHVNFLRQCSFLGEVVVSLNTDEFIEMYKNQKPLFSYEERCEHLMLCEYVSAVVPNLGGWDSTPAIEAVGPDIIAIGSDWATKDYHKQMNFTQDWLDKHDISLIYIPYTPGISTTEIKKRVDGR